MFLSVDLVYLLYEQQNGGVGTILYLATLSATVVGNWLQLSSCKSQVNII